MMTPSLPDFTLAVWPDTQYLFDGCRARPDLIRATTAALAHLQIPPIDCMIHVGDISEHGHGTELTMAREAFDLSGTSLDGTAQYWVCGNHDVDNDSDDLRGPTPFLEVFGPGTATERIVYHPTGYSWIAQRPHVQVIGVGWRTRMETLDWLRAHALDRPTVLVTHDAVHRGALTGYGHLIWDALVERLHGIFLVVAGHEWPSSRATLSTSDGRVVECHCVNLQERYAGGAGAVRLYVFSGGSCEVRTICPALELPEFEHAPAAWTGLGAHDPDNQFRFPLVTPTSPTPPRTVAPVTARTRRGYFTTGGARRVLLYARLSIHDARYWQVVAGKWGRAPDGTPEPLADITVSTERFLGVHIYTSTGEVWATSHELPLDEEITVMISTGGRIGGIDYAAGVWIDGQRLTRTNITTSFDLCATSDDLWSLGYGQWGSTEADYFSGTIHEFKMWELAETPLTR